MFLTWSTKCERSKYIKKTILLHYTSGIPHGNIEVVLIKTNNPFNQTSLTIYNLISLMKF